MRVFLPITVEAFEQAFDELFDQMLIGRWRVVERGIGPMRAILLDRGDRYEVQIFTGDVSVEEIGVEVAEHRLTVRMPSFESGRLEQSFDLVEPVDVNAVTSRWARRILITVLHKLKRHRRINVMSD